MIILIPSFEPDAQLPSLVRELNQATATAELKILVVNDGSGPSFEPIFAEAQLAGATVIGYPNNHGKGQALKTGFGYIAANFPGHHVVCADGDGQHAVSDILKVAQRVQTRAQVQAPTQGMKAQDSIVLGERLFSGHVPLRSSFGNSTTRLFFALATGTWLRDTQTGLRGYPAQLLPWLQSVRGNRYEYELNILLEARARGCQLDSVPIATIYLDKNESSHFRPLRDSLRIYAPLLKFSGSSFLGFLVDTVAFLILMAATGSLWLSVAGARAISAGINFSVNRRVVFPEGRSLSLRKSAGHYFALVILLLGANYGLLLSFTQAGMPTLPAKILTELVLFLLSFAVQKRFLFRPRDAVVPSAPAVSAAPVKPAAPVMSATSSHSQAQLPTNTDSAQVSAEI